MKTCRSRTGRPARPGLWVRHRPPGEGCMSQAVATREAGRCTMHFSREETACPEEVPGCRSGALGLASHHRPPSPPALRSASELRAVRGTGDGADDRPAAYLLVI